jgi:copper resistance protein B
LRLTFAALALAIAFATRIDAQTPSAASAAPKSSVSADQHPVHAHEPKAPEKPDATTPSPESPEPASQDEATKTSKPPHDLPAFIPRLTDEDRKAAFPEVAGHAAHDDAVHYFVLLDQFEWQVTDGASGINLDSKGWVGRDRDRLWFRAEGDADGGRVGEAQAHVLYGRQFSRWWDVVAGIRQDFRPGPAQTWAAIGLQGLAPYWFEIEATAYVGASGRTHARFEVEYELLLTNRLILQPLVEVEVFGKSDPERGVGAGVSTTDAGFRLRYEFRREVAPYVGVVWNNKWGKTADFADAAGEDTGGARLVMGVRLWF